VLPRSEILSPEAQALVEELLGEQEVEERERLRPFAEEVAIAEMDLMRIRSVRKALWESLVGGDSAEETPGGGRPQQGESTTGPLEPLERLARYDRRAFSRRKKAMRRFTQALAAEA
jgi:hypothetical protein